MHLADPHAYFKCSFPKVHDVLERYHCLKHVLASSSWFSLFQLFAKQLAASAPLFHHSLSSRDLGLVRLSGKLIVVVVVSRTALNCSPLEVHMMDERYFRVDV